jgi:phage terminase small subunit
MIKYELTAFYSSKVEGTSLLSVIPAQPFHDWLKSRGEVASCNWRERAKQLAEFTGLPVIDWSMVDDIGVQ